MYRIAICDNDWAELEAIVKCIKKYLISHPAINGEVHSFQDSRVLQKALNDNVKFDLFLLDILMPGIDGISLGRLIRRKNNMVPIVYITSTKEQAFDAYGVGALQYLIKPLDEKKLYDVLKTTYTLYKNLPRHSIVLKTTVGIQSVVKEDIMYIENQVRTAHYTLVDSTKLLCTRSYGSFEKAIAPLNSDVAFIQPHKSFFANMRFIKVFQDSFIIMDDNKSIPINQKRLPMIRKQYMDYLSKNVLGNSYEL